MLLLNTAEPFYTKQMFSQNLCKHLSGTAQFDVAETKQMYIRTPLYRVIHYQY